MMPCIQLIRADCLQCNDVIPKPGSRPNKHHDRHCGGKIYSKVYGPSPVIIISFSNLTHHVKQEKPKHNKENKIERFDHDLNAIDFIIRKKQSVKAKHDAKTPLNNCNQQRPFFILKKIFHALCFLRLAGYNDFAIHVLIIHRI